MPRLFESESECRITINRPQNHPGLEHRSSVEQHRKLDRDVVSRHPQGKASAKFRCHFHRRIDGLGRQRRDQGKRHRQDGQAERFQHPSNLLRSTRGSIQGLRGHFRLLSKVLLRYSLPWVDGRSRLGGRGKSEHHKAACRRKNPRRVGAQVPADGKCHRKQTAAARLDRRRGKGEKGGVKAHRPGGKPPGHDKPHAVQGQTETPAACPVPDASPGPVSGIGRTRAPQKGAVRRGEIPAEDE